MTFPFDVVLCLFWLATGASDTRQLVTLLEARYRPARTMQVRFLERYSENNRVIRSEAGIVYFRRQGKMRWEYEAPEKNLFLVDGKTAWFYVPGDHTVTRVPAKQSSDWRTPLALLAGEMKVSRVCARVQLAVSEKPEGKDHVMLQCLVRGAEPGSSRPDAGAEVPRQSKPRDAVFFEIARATGELALLLVRQSGGVQ